MHFCLSSPSSESLNSLNFLVGGDFTFPFASYGFLHPKIFHVCDWKTCIEESGIACIMYRDKDLFYCFILACSSFLTHPWPAGFYPFCYCIARRRLNWDSSCLLGCSLCCWAVCTGSGRKTGSVLVSSGHSGRVRLLCTNTLPTLLLTVCWAS